LNNIAPAKSAELSSAENISGKSVSIRVSPNSYFSALFLATFFAGFLIYLEYDWSAALLSAAAWICVPFFLWTDKIVFDGKRLTRVGFLPRLWATVNNSRIRLRITDIEQVETQALRALKRGGNVFYRYRTSVQGKGLHFAFASGGEEYREIIRRLFSALPENALDNRSIELRDYLAEPKETLTKARFAKIPSDDVLEDSFKAIKKEKNRKIREIGEAEEEKADYLRRLANELRLAGYFLQALEAFRRALLLKPHDAWLLFEFARCLYSFAGSERDARMMRRAVAALRLAEKRAEKDGELLARLGESWFQYGDHRRAQKAFQKSQENSAENFRALRGLAEIALREGKIAYVIHHFSAAFNLADTNALKRWTNGEAEYFSRLNADEEYMDLEISRIKLLETLERSKKTALRIAFFGFPAILIGVTLSETLAANIGWAISSIALVVWCGLLIAQKVLAERIPFELLDDED
jgi:tetratricopeptide (TPR) repeat protein